MHFEDVFRNSVRLFAVMAFLQQFIGTDWALRILALGVVLEVGRYIHTLLAEREWLNRRLRTMLDQALTELEAQDPEAAERVLGVLQKEKLG